MTWMEACEEIGRGRFVRRRAWRPGAAIFSERGALWMHHPIKGYEPKFEFQFTLGCVRATDWELLSGGAL
jgi:hypothetical protein